MSDIDITVEGMRRHAGRVESVARDVETARSAGAQVSMQATAYGLLCGPILAPVLGALEVAGLGTIAGAAKAVDGTAMALRAMATSLEVAEEHIKTAIDNAGGPLR